MRAQELHNVAPQACNQIKKGHLHHIVLVHLRVAAVPGEFAVLLQIFLGSKLQKTDDAQRSKRSDFSCRGNKLQSLGSVRNAPVLQKFKLVGEPSFRTLLNLVAQWWVMVIHAESASSDSTINFIRIHDESEGPAPHRANSCATQNPNALQCDSFA